MSTDIGDTLDRTRFNGLTIPVHTPADGDFLVGDANNGVPVSQGQTVTLLQNVGSVTDGLTVRVHNVTRGTNIDVSFGANTFSKQDPSDPLYFEAGDELALEVNGTTDATDGHVVVGLEADKEALGALGSA